MLWTCPWQPLQISLLEFRPGRCLFGLLVYVLVSVLELEDLTLPITVVIGMWEFLLYTEVARQEFSQSDFRLSALCVRASSEFFTFSSLIIGLCVTHDTICPWAKLFDIEWYLLFRKVLLFAQSPYFYTRKKRYEERVNAFICQISKLEYMVNAQHRKRRNYQITLSLSIRSIDTN